MTEAATQVFEIAGLGSMTLADLAGIDLSNVEAKEPGFFKTPVGIYVMRGADVENTVINDKPAIVIGCEIVGIQDIAGDANPNDLVGEIHRELIFWPGAELDSTNLEKFLGNFKHFMEAVGINGDMKQGEVVQAFNGHVFIAPVKQTPKRGDPDVKYSNIVRDKVVVPETPQPPANEEENVVVAAE